MQSSHSSRQAACHCVHHALLCSYDGSYVLVSTLSFFTGVAATLAILALSGLTLPLSSIPALPFTPTPVSSAAQAQVSDPAAPTTTIHPTHRTSGPMAEAKQWDPTGSAATEPALRGQLDALKAGFDFLGEGPCRDASDHEPVRYECRASSLDEGTAICKAACSSPSCSGWQVCKGPCEGLCVVFVLGRTEAHTARAHARRHDGTHDSTTVRTKPRQHTRLTHNSTHGARTAARITTPTAARTTSRTAAHTAA